MKSTAPRGPAASPGSPRRGRGLSGTRLRASALASASALLLLLGVGPLAPPPDAPLADAAQRGDADRVSTLVQQGADVNVAQGDGMTALHWAARHGHQEMVVTLLDAGARVDAVTRLGDYQPLHMAAELGHGAVVELLLSSGADADALTSTGVSALHLASFAGDTRSVEALLDRGADVTRVDDAKGRTALMFAAARNHAAVMEMLLEAGADLTAQSLVVDYQARSQEDRELRRAREERVKAEREAAAKAAGTWTGDEEDEEKAELVVDPDDPDVEQPVSGASTGEPVEPDEMPVEPDEMPVEPDEVEASDGEDDEKKDEPQPLGFDDLVGKQGGFSALHYAVRDGNRDAAHLLLEAGADIDVRTGGDQSTPLLVALINGHYDLALELMEMGADPNLASEDGVAALYAVLNNRWAPKAFYPHPTAFKQQEASYLDVMEALLEMGADPNARVKTHIWYASYNFDILGVNFRGASPFWRAAHALDVDAMRLLVAYGADPEVPTEKAPERRFRRRAADDEDKEDPSGLPPVPVGGPSAYPIHAASGMGYGWARAGNSHRHVPDGWLPAVKYLVEELGADVNQRDDNGYSAVHHAAARGDNELIEYLVSQGADVTFVSRRGQTTVDMANGPQQRVQPYPETIALLESLGAKNNHNCVSC